MSLSAKERDRPYVRIPLPAQAVEAWRRLAAIHPSVLTVQEREIVQRIAESQTTKEIAAAFGQPPKTIEWHHTRAFKKLGLAGAKGDPGDSKLAMLTRWAILHRLIGDGDDQQAGVAEQ